MRQCENRREKNLVVFGERISPEPIGRSLWADKKEYKRKQNEKEGNEVGMELAGTPCTHTRYRDIAEKYFVSSTH